VQVLNSMLARETIRSWALDVERWAFSALVSSPLRRGDVCKGWVAQLAEQWTANPVLLFRNQ
jgi:hypothetical protein